MKRVPLTGVRQSATRRFSERFLKDASFPGIITLVVRRRKRGATPGRYLVKFDAQTVKDTGKTETVNGEETPVMKAVSILQKRYDDENTSEFEVEVVPGANTFDFDLESN